MGGATESLIELIHLLREKFSIDSLVLTGFDDEVGIRLEKENIKHFFCGYRQFAVNMPPKGIARLKFYIMKPARIIRYHFSNLMGIKRVKKIDVDSINIIHSNVNRVDFGVLLSKKYNKPHIWHLRECPHGHFELSFNRLNAYEYMNINTTQFIAISKFVKEKWVENGIRPSKVKVIYHGVDLRSFTPSSEEKRNIRIVCVGKISRPKGQHIIIKASKYLRKIENDILIDFWGDGSKEYIKELKKEALETGVDIRFRGYSDDIGSILNNYDIGINPSINEGLGRTTIEYMAAGLVTLAINSGANKELVFKGFNGMFTSYIRFIRVY